MGVTSVTIRPAVDADKPAIAGLLLASWQDAYAGILPEALIHDVAPVEIPKYWAGIDLSPEDVVLVAEDGTGTIVGFISVWCRKAGYDEPFIESLHMAPDHRSGGIGRRLLSAGAEALIARGHRSACLLVFQGNRQAVRFYDRLGGARLPEAQTVMGRHRLMSYRVRWDDLPALAALAAV